MARVKKDPKKWKGETKKPENPDKIKKKKKEKKSEAPIVKPQTEKRRRDKDGRKMLRKIREAQRSTENVLPRGPVKRLVKEIAADIDIKGGIRFTPNAISAIQVAAEDHLVSVFRDAQYLQSDIAEGSKTLRPPAFRAATQLKPGNTVSLPKPKVVQVKEVYQKDTSGPMPTTEVAAGESSD